ncbi:hypothetical protein ABPG75_001524 [Micractinium tetrahymenae]
MEGGLSTMLTARLLLLACLAAAVAGAAPPRPPPPARLRRTSRRLPPPPRRSPPPAALLRTPPLLRPPPRLSPSPLPRLPPPPPSPSPWWSPLRRNADGSIFRFQYQLQDWKDGGVITVVPNVQAYIIDFDTAFTQIAAVRSAVPGVKVVCYFSAGVYEDYR